MMMTMTARKMVLCLTAGAFLWFSGLMVSRAEHEAKAKAPAIQVIESLSEMMIPKDKLPKDWKLLEKRLIRDHHDDLLLTTVMQGGEAFGAKVTDKTSQSFQVGKESFNVDMFWVPDGLERLNMFVAGWLNPVKWRQVSYEKVLFVVSTSNPELQSLVLKEYTKRRFLLIESKATKAIKNKDDALAEKYFKVFWGNGADFGRSYLGLAGAYLHQLNGPKEAVASYETALTYNAKSKFTDQELWSIYEGIGLAVYDIGKAASEIPDLKKVEEAFLKSYEVGQKAKNDTWSSSSAYNLACVYAELKDKDKAYKYLEISFNLNKKTVKGAADDSSFKDMKTEDRFKDLVKKYDKE